MGTSSQIGYLRDMIKCKLFFANNFERTGVWSAFCYCTFEEGPAIYCGRCPRSTQKCTYANWSMVCILLLYFRGGTRNLLWEVPSKYIKMHIRELEYVRIERKYTKMHILWFMVLAALLHFLASTPYTLHPTLYTLHPTLYPPLQ